MSGFSVKKVSVAARLLLLSSPQSDLCCEHVPMVAGRGCLDTQLPCSQGRQHSHSSAATSKAEMLIQGFCWAVLATPQVRLS